jgi:DNA-binding CsgD family transcriptional regulator
LFRTLRALNWVEDPDYEKALRAIFFMFALAFVIPVFDVTVFLMSVGFSAGGLLLISRIIDEFSADKRMTSGLIALSLAVSKGMLLVGLYVPGWFGVRSHAAYYQSTSLPLFMVYLVFVMILLFESKKLDVGNLSRLVSALLRIKDLAKDGGSAPASRNDEIDAVCRLLAYDFRLTKRETEILGYMARGRDKAFICDQLHLSRNTVKGYAKSLYRKLDVHSHQEIINKIESVKIR